MILITAGLLALATGCSLTFTGTPTPRPTYTPAPLIPVATTSALPTPVEFFQSDPASGNPTPVAFPRAETTGVPLLIQDPAQRHLKLKQLMLRLTNQHRAHSGVPPVRLGQNPAAQIHAEEALKGCYTAHWDRWGLKPNHRYTMMGGTGADSENGAGSSYCIKPGDNYAANSAMEKEVAETVQGWMDSPGHRRSLLDPAHTVLNIGIAWDKYNTNMVQHFSSDYIQYEVKPNISPDGILRLSGQVSRATLEIGDSVSIQIYHDPPPKPLTQGQLANTYALCNSRQVGYVVEPLGLNQFYTSPEVRTQIQEFKCVDPYETNPNRQAPKNNDEAHQAWADAKLASSKGSSKKTEVRQIIAKRFNISRGEFNIRADLTPILRKNGPGIYSILLWGRPLHMSESTPLSEQSIFWQTNPPANNPYSQTWSPAPAEIFPTKQARTPTPDLAPTPFTKRVASTPTPQPQVQAPRPFQAAVPTPAHTPTAIPFNIHARTVDQYSYSMEFPPGWIPTQESDGRTTFLSLRGTAGAAIRIWRIDSNDAANLPKEHMEKLLERMRTAAERGDSGIFEMQLPWRLPAAITKHLWQARQMEYRWRESPDECIRDVVDIISPSNWYTHGVLIIAWICEKDLDGQAENERQKMLTSFREKVSR